MADMTLAELVSYGVEWPPTEDELPCADGMPLETHRHVFQMQLLMDPLRAYLTCRRDAFVGGNMFVYFSLEQVRHQDFRGPDFFVALTYAAIHVARAGDSISPLAKPDVTLAVSDLLP